MTLTHRILLALGLAAAAHAGLAADLPKRKSGLWEIKTSTAGAPDITMQMCIDEKQDDLASARGDAGDIRKRCPKIDSKRSGNTIVIDTVCKFEQTTMTGHTVVTGNLATDYRMESTTRFDPPMHGMASTSTVMTGRLLGPCKPGQKHGSMVMSGMPGGGQFELDPKMMEQMRKMQEQYGR